MAGRNKSIQGFSLAHKQRLTRGYGKEAQGDVDFTLLSFNNKKQRPHNGLPRIQGIRLEEAWEALKGLEASPRGYK
ncbi:hypothetical protein Tco_1207379 [Tanacetum coccineum]